MHTTEWTITKRDGRVERFHPPKVYAVIRKCLVDGLGRDGEETEPVVRRVGGMVLNLLAGQGNTAPHVEDVQRAVISQLWADGHYTAAEHFTLYREERRRARLEKPLDPDAAELIRREAAQFPTQIQAYQFYSKFARWREADRRRETWGECNDRVFDWFGTLPCWSQLRADEVDWLRHSMHSFRASPAMRVLQMAGPALERCHMGVYNCAGTPIDDLRSFAELLYILMQGSGCSFSVESCFIDKLPRVRRQRRHAPRRHYVVPDDTEGWCDALLFGLESWFDGYDVEYDFSRIRAKNTKLKTKGGRASGPEPLRQLLTFARDIVLGAQGRRLTDLECHDLGCMTGRIVQVGGVRRAACLSHSDLNSKNMREAKHGNWWVAHPHRSMANNSAVYEFDGLPPLELFLEEMTALIRSKSGERGILNRRAAQRHRPRRRKNARFLVNPCAEINFRPRGLCNLTIAVLRGDESEAVIIDKVRAAAYFGVVQSTATKFRYVRDAWRRNAEEERLIGVDVMGHLDHPLLRPGAPDRAALVTRMKEAVAAVVADLSVRFGINYSAANTCLKPGGDSGVFFHSCTLGGYPSEYQIRTTRERMDSPVTAMLRDQGVPVEQDLVNPELAVISWPRKNPAGCVTEGSMGAVEQLENWLFWKKTWCEHSASVTIHVKEEEWPAVIAWLYNEEHFGHLTGVSFLPYDGHTYKQAPNQRLTKEEYDKFADSFPAIDWAQLLRYETEDATESAMTPACTAGGCSL